MYPKEAPHMTTSTIAFDANRAVLQDYLNGYPARLIVEERQPLAEALAQGNTTPETRLLAFELNDALYVIPMNVVLSYNVIQGAAAGQPWMMTFCNACNTGMVFDPTVDGRLHHFQRRGSYDGLLLIWDEETDSFWQHITGACLHGASQGRHLRVLTPSRQMSASEAAERTGAVWFLNSTLTPEQQSLSKAMEKMRVKPERLESGIMETVAEEDTRRPRFELGLGVWTERGSEFFPLVLLHAHDNVYQTELDGRPLLVYQQPEALAPVAVYYPSARAQWHDDTLRLDDGNSIRNDQLHRADGRVESIERPMQLLMRWYGFALTFPGCRVPRF
jgi:hypothetical protein